MINAIPSYQGYAEQLLVDDKNQIWILTRAVDRDPEWLVYDLEGDLIGGAFHPGGTFKQIKDYRAYIAYDSDDEAPGFSVYSIKN